MKRIISILIIAAMMIGCGKLQQLSQPVETKTVEVPAKFSWKSEFTGNRLIAKGVFGAIFAGSIWKTYRSAHKKGYIEGRAETDQEMYDAYKELQMTANYQSQRIEALENEMKTISDKFDKACHRTGL